MLGLKPLESLHEQGLMVHISRAKGEGDIGDILSIEAVQPMTHTFIRDAWKHLLRHGVHNGIGVGNIGQALGGEVAERGKVVEEEASGKNEEVVIAVHKRSERPQGYGDVLRLHALEHAIPQAQRDGAKEAIMTDVSLGKGP